MKLPFAGAFNFAHLIGLSPSAKEHGDDEEDMRTRGEREECDDEEGEEEYAEGEEHEDGEGEEEPGKGKKSRKGKKGKKGKKAKEEGEEHEDGEDGEDGDEDEDEGEEHEKDEGKKAAHRRGRKVGVKVGRRAERKRCGAIFASPAAAANVQLAAKLAFNTSLTADAAITILESTPRPNGLATRMANVAVPKIPPGGSIELKGAQAIDAAWGLVMKEFMPPAH